VAAGRGAPWSTKTDQLVRHIALRCRPGLRAELAHWIENNPRFAAFIATNQDKVRKKLNTAEDEEHRLDVRAELLVAFLITADRRFELAFEAYGAHRVGPDLTVTFRANQRFNLEVTRLRLTGSTEGAPGGLAAGPAPASDSSDDPAVAGGPAPGVTRLANVISGKVRQLPGETPNGLVMVAHGLAVDENALNAAARLLKTHTDGKNDAFFARRGLKDARSFYAQYLHLGGIFVVDEANVPPGAIFWPNREARHPLSREAITALVQCLTAGTRAD
jgi:hypothetical protein